MLQLMKRVPRQAVLPFGRGERALNKRIGNRMQGKKAGRGLGRSFRWRVW